MKIITDSSIMLTIEQGAQRNITVLPLAVTIGDKTWLEYEEINAQEFLKCIKEGGVPTSASPPAALTLEAYDTEEEILHITMAHGLSGAYEVACGLKAQARHPERVHILNSQTLCVPQRALVYYALDLAKENLSAEAMLARLGAMIETTRSYLIPSDFDFLRRGGRLTPLAAKFAGLLKTSPVMTQTSDGTRLERLTVACSFAKAINSVVSDLRKRACDETYFISVSHADCLERATDAMSQIREHFPHNPCGIFNLGPAFITQGGPGCVAVQTINMKDCQSIELGA